MKRMYFSYNKFTDEYYLDEGSFAKNRKFLKLNGSKNFLKKFPKEINPKRKTDLFVDSQIPREILKNIEKMFKDTKINIKLEKL